MQRSPPLLRHDWLKKFPPAPYPCSHLPNRVRTFFYKLLRKYMFVSGVNVSMIKQSLFSLKSYFYEIDANIFWLQLYTEYSSQGRANVSSFFSTTFRRWNLTYFLWSECNTEKVYRWIPDNEPPPPCSKHPWVVRKHAQWNIQGKFLEYSLVYTET